MHIVEAAPQINFDVGLAPFIIDMQMWPSCCASCLTNYFPCFSLSLPLSFPLGILGFVYKQEAYLSNLQATKERMWEGRNTQKEALLAIDFERSIPSARKCNRVVIITSSRPSFV